MSGSEFDTHMASLKASPAYDPILDALTVTREEFTQYQDAMDRKDLQAACDLMDCIAMRAHSEQKER